jgi:hypothetical protein
VGDISLTNGSRYWHKTEVAQGMPEEWWNREPWEEIQWSGTPMPKEWWEKKFPTDLAKLINTLSQRRSKIRDLITAFPSGSATTPTRPRLKSKKSKNFSKGAPPRLLN